MAAFAIDRHVDAALPAVWRAVTDFGAYARWFPLTRIRLDPPPTRVGWGFAGITGVGGLAFSDSMIITRWAPPDEAAGRASFRLVKTGRLLGGWAEIELQAAGQDGTSLSWREQIVLRPEPLGRLMAPGIDPILGRLFERALDRMLAAEPGARQ